MKKFVSWSGGKDCCFALYKYLQLGDDDIGCLLNMIRNTDLSGHRLSNQLFENQAEMLGVDLVREKVMVDNSYIYHFDKVVNQLKDNGYDGGIFGDIYLENHRNWIEQQCNRLGITPIFPLWGMDVNDIYKEFVDSGFEAMIIGVRKEYKELLGSNLDMELYERFKTYENFDICGENGEYHTFVVNAPIFSRELEHRIVDRYENEKLCGLELDIKLDVK